MTRMTVTTDTATARAEIEALIGGRAVPDALAATVERYGDRPAYSDKADGRSEWRTFTWQQMYDAARDVAAALVSNHFAMLTSPAWEMQRAASAHAIRGTGQILQWLATDTADAWVVERRPDGATWRPGTQQADVTVFGPARSLLLTLTRRHALTEGDATEISIDGDTDLARHWIDNTAHVSG